MGISEGDARNSVAIADNVAAAAAAACGSWQRRRIFCVAELADLERESGVAVGGAQTALAVSAAPAAAHPSSKAGGRAGVVLELGIVLVPVLVGVQQAL